jgi:hypothetical protein
MDWRLIAAVAAAAGSFCLVAVGARVVLTSSPPQRQTVAAAPTLTSDYRFPAAETPSLMRVQPSTIRAFAGQTSTGQALPSQALPSQALPSQAFPSQAFPSQAFPSQAFPSQAFPSQAFPSQALPSQASASPFAAQDDSTPSVFATEAAVAPGRVDTSPPLVNPPLVTDKSLPGRPEPRAGYKTAAVTPNDGVLPAERPARPLVEAKRPSVVPELRTALPASHYRGVLTSSEIARIRHNLRLTPEQEPAWPRVEAALAEMGRQQMALIRQGQEPRISPNDWPPSRLYAAAGPLLQTLRPDQKETVRKVCRSLGFESVASML